ncbi:glycosyltransferase, partial [Acidithiobacillus sp.]|uniref:glycosyltransferase family protein n=1 Tax=Acidithiobacillus sp. TaxID=1872118 RepID=UPI003563570F
TDEFFEKFEYYVKNPQSRHSICMSAMQNVLKNHTYTHRVNEMMNIINLFMGE